MVTAKSVIVVILVVFLGVNGIERDPNWAKKLLEVLKVRDSYVANLQDVKKSMDSKKIEDLISVLKSVPGQLKGIDNLDLSIVETNKNILREIFKEPEEPIVTKFFASKKLKRNYETRGLGFILRTMRASYDYRCLLVLLSPPPKKPSQKSLPIETMCSRVKEDVGKQDTFVFSTAKICKSVKQCSGVETAFPYGDTDGTNAKDACTKDNKCDIEKAIPMMGALLWYKISDFIAKSFCSNSLGQPDETAILRRLEDIQNMAHLIMAYGSTFYWKDFFTTAVFVNAFSNLEKAMELVQKRENALGFVSLACSELQAEDMCDVGSIHKEYQSLKKLKNDLLNPPQTRNLRLYSKIDHAKMIELKQNALKHIELLGNIRKLDENLRAAVKGISNYFKGLAEYDQGIAQADVTFLSDKLKEFDKQATTLSEKLEKDVKAAMTALLVTQAAQVIEESTILGLKIAQQMNPLKVFFSGVEAGEVYEQTAEVARAVQELARGSALMANLYQVYDDTSALAKSFQENANQISNLDVMVNAIKENKIDQIGFDADKFVEAYGAYTPKVNRSQLAKNDALWAAFKASTCDLLFNAQGVGAAVSQGVVGGMLLCENLEGTLAEFAALRENIFDFQFDLVDALARVVRGIVAKKLAESITVSNDLLDASKLMVGFFMTQYRLQSHAALYCDKLEYLNQGTEIGACSSTGFFTEHSLNTLVAFNPDTTYDVDERFIYIPTRPQFVGDIGFINLPSLARGESVTFRIPAKRELLRKYNWLARGEQLAPFVESFKLYLPLREYKEGDEKQHSRTRIQLTSVAGSAFTENADIVYNLPFEDSNYLTIYSEGYDRCPNGKEIVNPYSLCKNLPKVCDTNTRVPPLTKSIMPTILSTWKLSYTVETGDRDLTWNAPNPATDLLIIGKVKLRFLPRPNKKRVLVYRKDEFAFGCCTGNTYRKDWRDKTCTDCPQKPPTDSKSMLDGYYCEKGDEPVASKPPEN